jgi:hypothetical protein
MSDTSPKDEVKAVAEIVRNEAGQIRICDAEGNAFDMSKYIGSKFFDKEALSQVRKQALLEAAEVFDKQTGREMFGPTVAEELRKLAEE